MTVTYSLEVSKSRLCGFAKLLLRWRGSIYKLMYREMLLYIGIYYSLAIFYRYVLQTEFQRRIFESICVYCREFTSLIPITFVMGLYVSLVAARWWQQYLCIPWPDRCTSQVAAFVQGIDDRGRLIRRALARYLNLMSVLTFRMVSTVVKKRFPTIDHLVEAGIMTVEERMAIDQIHTVHPIWWVPCTWFCQLAMAARKEGRIHDDLHLKSIIDEALKFRSDCGMMVNYDWISIPLVYTQTVTLSVYCFFLACVFGRQYLYEVPEGFPPSHIVDYYVPLFTFFQFFFYMGWLKVAEEMICAYGEDDDDFELNYILDRNVEISYLVVDGLYGKYPKLSYDQFWDIDQMDIPYTTAAAPYKTEPFIGSTMSMNVNPKDMEWQLDFIAEEKSLPTELDDIESNDAEPISVYSPEMGRRSHVLNTLLAGDSRSSLAQPSPTTKFGSKLSMFSSRDFGQINRQLGAHQKALRGSETVINQNSSIWAEHVEDFVPGAQIAAISDQTDAHRASDIMLSVTPEDPTDDMEEKMDHTTVTVLMEDHESRKSESDSSEDEKESSSLDLLTDSTPLLQHEQAAAEEEFETKKFK